jgi:hypothetical protein
MPFYALFASEGVDALRCQKSADSLQIYSDELLVAGQGSINQAIKQRGLLQLVRLGHGGEIIVEKCCLRVSQVAEPSRSRLTAGPAAGGPDESREAVMDALLQIENRTNCLRASLLSVY